jgi:phenylacetic acid degradation operon negative regulatory protein
MRPKTFEFLCFLLWTAERLTRPTVRNLTDSYESWAYRNGLLRQLNVLEKQQLIERVPSNPEDRLYRLTPQGRLTALGGRDPQTQWSRPWDGYWRLVIFDVPNTRNAHRQRLRRYLRERGFGCVQKSVWITPDPMHEEKQLLADAKTNVKSLLLLEAQPATGESDSQIVAGGWDFQRINKTYTMYLEVLDRRPDGSLRDPELAKALRQWATEERHAWLAAVSVDPLLPKRLLPEGYLGCDAWRRRVEALAKASKQLRTFKNPKPTKL